MQKMGSATFFIGGGRSSPDAPPNVNRGRPYGFEPWITATIDRFKLESTIRNSGRPRKGI